MMVAPTEFYVFRHGETDWNRARRIQGHTDIPLNAIGRDQAAQLAQRIHRFRLDAVVTSDLARAQATARLVCERTGVPLIIDPRLREACFGEAEGMVIEDIVAKYSAAQWERWRSDSADSLDFRFPGGESKREHQDRMRASLEELARREPHWSRIGVSTHGGSLRRLLDLAQDTPREIARISNCSLFSLTWDRAAGVWSFRASIET